jgi:hypothetical protein
MSAKDPCSEMFIEVRSLQLRWACGVELISAPRGYGRIISSCRHRISLQDLRYRNTQAGLSSACQMVFRDYGSDIAGGGYRMLMGTHSTVAPLVA